MIQLKAMMMVSGASEYIFDDDDLDNLMMTCNDFKNDGDPRQSECVE